MLTHMNAIIYTFITLRRFKENHDKHGFVIIQINQLNLLVKEDHVFHQCLTDI